MYFIFAYQCNPSTPSFIYDRKTNKEVDEIPILRQKSI